LTIISDHPYNREAFQQLISARGVEFSYNKETAIVREKSWLFDKFRNPITIPVERYSMFGSQINFVKEAVAMAKAHLSLSP